MPSTKRAAHAQRSAFPLSFLLLGCISSRQFLLSVCWEGQPGEGGAETDRNLLQGTRVCPSPLGFPCVPPCPAPHLLLTQWSLTRSVSLVTSVLCISGTAGGPAGGTCQCHPHQQLRGNSGAGAVCGVWDVICCLCTAGTRGPARDCVRCCGGAGNKNDGGATWSDRIPSSQLGPCRLWRLLPALD